MDIRTTTIELMHIVIKMAKDMDMQPTPMAIIPVTAKELMNKTGISKKKALLESSLAWAETESSQLPHAHIDLNKSTSHAITLHIEGNDYVLSLKQIVDGCQLPVAPKKLH